MNETIRQYGKKPPFSSFLPGVAGVKGIPIWCYYVNRGQAVVSFGVDNKDHPIMEFLPAHRAYTKVRQTGFRTFVRRDGAVRELFTQEENGTMTIGMNVLGLEEKTEDLVTCVQYFVLPEEHVGALVRRVCVTNPSAEPIHLEVLDGMPEIVPYGVTDWTLKNMLQTGKAWMQVEDTETKAPFYRVRASMEDTTDVAVIEGGNFAVSFDEAGKRLPMITDPAQIFDYDLAMERPLVFTDGGLAKVQTRRGRTSNFFPCAFTVIEAEVGPGESLSWNTLIGQVESKDILQAFLEGTFTGGWFAAKEQRAVALTDRLTDCIDTHTADPRFDAYCRYTYMDNVLRGGCPMLLGDKVFYAYSRKHGDLERDYNYFSMLPEFYSQGNGNFRDVNQNRRSDTFFSPFVGRYNLHMFYDMIQLDGYNPLSVEMQTFTPEGETEALTPGQIYARLEREGTPERFEEVMRGAKGQLNAKFNEGFWSDHWTYNLDLVEEYLAIWPDKEEDLLFTPEYTWFPAQAMVRPRASRYEETVRGIRQYDTLERVRDSQGLYVKDVNGEIVCSSLMEKLIVLCLTKFAGLDPYAMGLEMESGRPGWYDALNGLPGILGSSMNETYELKRMLDFVLARLQKYDCAATLPEEAVGLGESLYAASQIPGLADAGQQLAFWNAINDAKEAYREKVFDGPCGKRIHCRGAELAEKIESLRAVVDQAICKADALGAPAPAYFSYEVIDYEKDDAGIHPLHFAQHALPPFLEGAVRRMKLDGADAAQIYDQVRSSALFDEKLSMYRVNAPLDSESYEIGRCRAFTSGWLENASIWLHMEYKYLLETLKAGLYPQFFADLQKTCIPFLDPEVYGRSTLENSSFLASSLNPDEEIHGRGFVARLSGSTAEFLSIWRRMMFGAQPFIMKNGALVCALAPALPGWLIRPDKTVSAMFLGQTKVTYHLPDQEDLIPGAYRIKKILVDGVEQPGPTITGATAEKLRAGQISTFEVWIKK
ncbi:MAG: hypothetical protein IJ917_00960 [Firmicutes bacterium]|nr:hypothetical protein [Bacillota bacterium]